MAMLDELGLAHRDLADAGGDRRTRIPFADDETHAAYDPRPGRTTSGARSCRSSGCCTSSAAGSSARPARSICSGAGSTWRRRASRAGPRRRIPAAPRTAGPHVMLEAYSHEVSSCGYWPGGDGEGNFYTYAYPEPDGLPRRARRARRRAAGTTSSASSCCPTRPSAPRPIPTRCCSNSCRRRTRPPPNAARLGPRRARALDALEDDDRDHAVGLRTGTRRSRA